MGRSSDLGQHDACLCACLRVCHSHSYTGGLWSVAGGLRVLHKYWRGPTAKLCVLFKPTRVLASHSSTGYNGPLTLQEWSEREDTPTSAADVTDVTPPRRWWWKLRRVGGYFAEDDWNICSMLCIDYVQLLNLRTAPLTYWTLRRLWNQTIMAVVYELHH